MEPTKKKTEVARSLESLAEWFADLVADRVAERLEIRPATVAEHLNTGQAAEMIGMSIPTLNAWRMAGEGPAYFKIGRRVVYSRADLERWLETRRRGR